MSGDEDRLPKGEVDWQQVRQRLGQAQRQLGDLGELSPEEEHRVLNERARILGETPPDPADSESFEEILTFQMAGESFAVATTFVREVTELQRVTAIPGAPDFMVGVANLRGEVTAVLDLSVFFGEGENAAATDQCQVIVLGTDRAEFGIRVDRIDQVTTLGRDEILEPPGNVSRSAREFIVGVTADATTLLDGDVLLQTNRLYMDDAE